MHPDCRGHPVPTTESGACDLCCFIAKLTAKVTAKPVDWTGQSYTMAVRSFELAGVTDGGVRHWMLLTSMTRRGVGGSSPSRPTHNRSSTTCGALVFSTNALWEQRWEQRTSPYPIVNSTL